MDPIVLSSLHSSFCSVPATICVYDDMLELKNVHELTLQSKSQLSFPYEQVQPVRGPDLQAAWSDYSVNNGMYSESTGL